MDTRPVRLLLEFDDQVVLVGVALMEGDISGSRWDLRMPGLPDVLRALAEQHESAITTGPPEATWLTGES